MACVWPVPDGVDLHGALVLVDAVDDAVGPAACGVVAVEGLIEWLADAVRLPSNGYWIINAVTARAR